MFELLTLVVFIWLLVKAIGLVFVGGIALLVPIIMIAIAAGILKACICNNQIQ